MTGGEQHGPGAAAANAVSTEPTGWEPITGERRASLNGAAADRW